MGLYDEIKCEYKLPEAPKVVQNDMFQTKDFECAMEYYTITEGGELVHHIYEYYEVPEEDRPHYGTPEWDNKPFYKLVGSIGSKFIEYKKIYYHGIINIYTIASDEEWWEYEIKFAGDKIIDVKRVKQEWMKRNKL